MVANAALVTCAGSPLGTAMALMLADLGYDVALQDAAPIENLANEICAKGRKAVALQAELGDNTALDALIPAASSGLGGPLTCLVNNAAPLSPDALANITRAHWDQQMDTALWAPLRLSQLFAKQAPKSALAEKGEPFAQGLIVNIIDQRVSSCAPDFMTHSVVTAGMQAFTQTAALDLAPDIRVNAIGLGPQRPGQYQFAAHASEHSIDDSEMSDFCQAKAALRYFSQAPAVTGQLLCVHVE